MKAEARRTPGGERGVWAALRAGLHLGQRVSGRVCWIPKPGRIGIGIDLGLQVKGFVDVLMLPHDPSLWPTLDTVMEFEIVALDDRPQVRLLPVDPRYRVDPLPRWLSNRTADQGRSAER